MCALCSVWLYVRLFCCLLVSVSVTKSATCPRSKVTARNCLELVCLGAVPVSAQARAIHGDADALGVHRWSPLADYSPKPQLKKRNPSKGLPLNKQTFLVACEAE